MIELVNARVTSLDVDFHELTWQVAPTGEDVLDYETHILRSEAEEGPFDEIAGPLVDRYHFVDNIIQVQNRWRRYWYLLRVIKRGTSEQRDHGPISNEPQPDLMAMELRRHLRLLFTEFAGRRCIVLPRRTFGARCECFSKVLNKKTRSGCHTCFPPGTLVRTESGLEPIERVRAGHRVLSSDGHYHEVTKVFETKYSGDLVSVLPSTATRPILSTPEHPYLVLRGAHNLATGCGPSCGSYIVRGDGNPDRPPSVRQIKGGRWWARAQVNGRRPDLVGKTSRKSLGTYATKEEAEAAVRAYRDKNALPGHVLDWDDAANISQRDWLVTKAPSKIQDVEIINVPLRFRQRTTQAKKRLGSYEFAVDTEFMWMIGMYLAEGSSGRREINFSLHEKEVEYQQRLMVYFKGLGYNPSLVPASDGGKGVSVVVPSTTLAEWFPTWLGRKCYFKRVPEELMALPAKKTWALIQGVFDGDGHKAYQEITQTSEVLALQLAELLHRMGEQPLIRRQRSNVPTPKGNKRALAFAVSWARPTAANRNRRGCWNFGKEELTAVKETGLVAYDGPVYNLEVAGDHTYVVQNIVVHNCFDTSYVRGYLHPIEAWIQVDPSPKTKQVTGTGNVTQQDNTTMRLGYYPAVKPDDLIIEPENKRWRVIQQNQTEHSRAAVHQELQVHRIPESDIEFRIPVKFEEALPNLYLTPERNFTNPQNLDNVGADKLPGIFSIYRY